MSLQLTTKQGLWLLESELSEAYCNLETMFDNVKVLPSSTASPSTQLIVSIKPNETNKVLKQYIKRRDRQHKPNQIFVKFLPDVNMTMNRSLVEIAIYKYLNYMLIQSKVTPHIMKYIASAYCEHAEDHVGLFDDDHIKRWFRKDDYLRHESREVQLSTLSSARILFTEMGFGSTLESLFINQKLDVKYFNSIIFQVGYTLMQMSKVGVRHNDLHLGNIWVNILPKPMSTVYIIGRRRFHIKSIYFVKIYDFDLATFTIPVPEFLENDLINTYQCDYFGLCSTPDPLYDWYTFCSMLHMMVPILKQQILDASSRDLNLILRYNKRIDSFLYEVIADPDIFSKKYYTFRGRFCEKTSSPTPCNPLGVVPPTKLNSFQHLIMNGYFNDFELITRKPIPPKIQVYTSL